MKGNRVKKQLLCFVLSVFLTVQASGCSVLFKQEESSQTNQSQNSEDPQNMKIIEARDFHEGYAWVKSSNALCLIDKTGKIIKSLPERYFVCKDFCNGMSAINTDMKVYNIGDISDDSFVVNTKGETVFTISEKGFKAYNDIYNEKLHHSTFDGFDSHSVIIEKNFDDFERSGNYLCHYNIDTNALTEITSMVQARIAYLGSGYYWSENSSYDFEYTKDNDVLKFYQYNSGKVFSVGKYEKIEKDMGTQVFLSYRKIQPYDNGTKVWAYVSAYSNNDESIDNNTSKDYLFIIDLINENYDSIELDSSYHYVYNENIPEYAIPIVSIPEQEGYIFDESYELTGKLDILYDLHIGEFIKYDPNIDYQCSIKNYSNKRFLCLTTNNNGTEFFTIITDNKPLFTPKKYSEQTALMGDYVVFDSDEGVQIMNLEFNSVQSTISNSKLVYSDRTNSIIWVSDNTNTYTECYDVTTGKVLFKLNESVTALSDFSDDMVPVQSSSGNAIYYVNKSGEKLEIH